MTKSFQLAPIDIASAVFEVLGDAVVAGDFDTFAELFQVPLTMAQGQSNITVSSYDDLRKMFMERHNRIKAVGASQLVRVCVDANYDTPERIYATHVGHLIKDGEQLSEPQPIYTVMEKKNGDWKITANECAVWVNETEIARQE